MTVWVDSLPFKIFLWYLQEHKIGSNFVGSLTVQAASRMFVAEHGSVWWRLVK